MQKVLFPLLLIFALLAAVVLSGCSEDEPFERTPQEKNNIQKLRDGGVLIEDYWGEETPMEPPMGHDMPMLFQTVPATGGTYQFDFTNTGGVIRMISYCMIPGEESGSFVRIGMPNGDTPESDEWMYKIRGTWVFSEYEYETDSISISCTTPHSVSITLAPNTNNYDRVCSVEVGKMYFEKENIPSNPFEPLFGKAINNIVLQQAAADGTVSSGFRQWLTDHSNGDLFEQYKMPAIDPSEL